MVDNVDVQNLYEAFGNSQVCNSDGSLSLETIKEILEAYFECIIKEKVK